MHQREEYFYQPSAGHGLAHDPFATIVAPRPIGWISSRSASGVLHLAPYSFFNAFNHRPPIVGFASVGWKDSVANVAQCGVFGWSLVTVDVAEAMNATSASVDHSVDEFELAGLTPAPSKLIDVPRVAEARISFECLKTDIVRLRSSSGNELDTWLVLGEVVGVHIDKTLLADGVLDMRALRTVVRAGGPASYARIEPDSFFEMKRPR